MLSLENFVRFSQLLIYIYVRRASNIVCRLQILLATFNYIAICAHAKRHLERERAHKRNDFA